MRMDVTCDQCAARGRIAQDRALFGHSPHLLIVRKVMRKSRDGTVILSAAKDLRNPTNEPDSSLRSE
jgi:hypothetical protein